MTPQADEEAGGIFFAATFPPVRCRPRPTETLHRDHPDAARLYGNGFPPAVYSSSTSSVVHVARVDRRCYACPMRFGIFFEMSTPRPFGRGIERQVYHNALEQARLADELGFDWVWAVEHHFLEEYSHCSAPEVVLSAVAAQTQRIRVGHGAVVCVPEMNHPIRVAERAAALDIISDGRLEFGTARSSTWTELGGFEVDPDDTKKTWDEFVRVLPRMWADEPFVLRRSVLLHARTQRPAEAGPEAASPDVGHGHQPRHRARRRPSGAWAASAWPPPATPSRSAAPGSTTGGCRAAIR